jgi:hypothetical protein
MSISRRDLALVLAAAACVAGHASVANAASLKKDLLAYWQFNGNGNDSSGNGNTLALFGGADYAKGLFGKDLSLDGVEGSYAQATANNTQLDLGGEDFTIQVWANQTIQNEAVLIEKFSGETGPGWTFYTLGSSLQFYANGVLILTADVALQSGVWQQFVVERSGGTINLYFDGQLAGTGPISGSLGASKNALLVGARNAQDGRNFTLNGEIDEVAIWERRLSSSEISKLWNGGNGQRI